MSQYRKKILEMQIKLNNKERIILEQRNVVLDKQITIEELEEEIINLKTNLLNESLNIKIKIKECTECKNTTIMSFKCENEYCCNYI